MLKMIDLLREANRVLYPLLQLSVPRKHSQYRCESQKVPKEHTFWPNVKRQYFRSIRHHCLILIDMLALWDILPYTYAPNQAVYSPLPRDHPGYSQSSLNHSRSHQPTTTEFDSPFLAI